MGDPARWRDPRTQAQLALWGDRLRALGVDLENQELEAELWDLAQGYLRARAIVTAPFEPYGQLVPQFWGMFKAPSLSPSTIAIDVEEGEPAAWRVVYESRSEEHDHLARTLDHNRLRKHVGRVGYDDALFADLAVWLARRTFADFPEATRVRVRRVRHQSLPPEARRAGAPPSVRPHGERVFRREDLR